MSWSLFIPATPIADFAEAVETAPSSPAELSEAPAAQCETAKRRVVDIVCKDNIFGDDPAREVGCSLSGHAHSAEAGDSPVESLSISLSSQVVA